MPVNDKIMLLIGLEVYVGPRIRHFAWGSLVARLGTARARG